MDNKTQIILTAVDQTAGAINSAAAGLSRIGQAAATIAPQLAAAFSGAAIAGFVKSAVDAADQFNDLSQKTGVAVQSLAAYKLAAEQSGTSLDAVAKGMGRLSKELFSNGEAFRKLGVDTSSLDSAMGGIAELFADLPDGVEKSALALELFGKAGAELIPFLNLGKKGLQESADAAKRFSAVMAAMAPQADKFNDTLAAIGLNARASGAEFANELLPTLQLLADELLDASRNSEAFKTAGEGVNQMLLGLAATAAGITAAFSAVGKTIGAAAAQLGALASGNLNGAKSIGDAWLGDMAKVRADFDAFVLKLGQPVQVQAGDGLKKTGAAADDAKKRVADMLKALKDGAGSAKKPVDELAQLLNRLNTKDSSLDASYWKDLQTLFAGYQSGKVSVDEYRAAVQKLTEQQKFHADAVSAAKKAEDEWLKSVEKAQEAIDKSIEGIQDKARAIEEEVANYGKAKSEIESTIIARLEEQRAIAAGVDGQEQLVANLDREIAARRELRDALSMQDAQDKATKAAEASAKAWDKFADDIERSLTDSLYRAFESGEDMGEAFAKALQNTFKTTVLKFAVQLSLDVAKQGVSSLVGGGGAAGGSSLSRGSDILSIGSSASQLAAGVGASAASLGAANVAGAVGGDALGTLIAGNAGTWGVSSAGVGGLSGALGGLAAAAPWIAGALAIYSIAKKYFGDKGGPKVESGYSNAGGATGAAGGELGTWANASADAFNRIAEKYDSAIRASSVGAGLATDPQGDARTQLNLALSSQTGQVLYDRMAQYGGQTENVGRSAEELSAAMADTLRDSVLIAVEKADIGTPAIVALFDQFAGSLGDLSAERADALTAALTGGWLDQLLATVDETAIGIEGVADAAVRLAEVVALKPLMDELGLSFFDLGASLASAFGGVDNASAAMASYYDTFYSAEEKTERLRSNLTESFSALNLTLPASKDAFRDLIESLDLTTESGQRAFATMLTLAPSFATLTDQMDAAAKVAADAAADAADALARIAAGRQSWQDKLDVLTGKTTERDLALRDDLAGTTDEATRALIRQVYAQEDAAEAARIAAGALEQAATTAKEAARIAEEARRQAVTDARNALGAAVDAERQRLQEASNARLAALQTSADAARDRQQAIAGLAQRLRPAADDLSLDSAARQRLGRSAAQADLDRALAAGRSGRSLAPFADSITAAIDTLQKPSADLYGSFEDYARDQGRAAATAAELASTASAQSSVADLTLKALEAGIAAEKRWFDDEARRLDDILKAADDQIAHLDGINRSVLTVAQAVAGLARALGVAEAAKAAQANAGSSATATVGGAVIAAIADEAIRKASNGKVTTAAGNTYYTQIKRSTPAFAAGGLHDGGYAIVGEQGPELAYMPPSRIYSNADTKALLDIGPLLEEIAALREDVQRLQGLQATGNRHAERAATVLDDAARGRNPLTTEAAA